MRLLAPDCVELATGRRGCHDRDPLVKENIMSTANAPATSTSAVARELVDLCRAGRNGDAIDRLY
jgi:hypothetical protein